MQQHSTAVKHDEGCQNQPGSTLHAPLTRAPKRGRPHFAVGIAIGRCEQRCRGPGPWPVQIAFEIGRIERTHRRLATCRGSGTARLTRRSAGQREARMRATVRTECNGLRNSAAATGARSRKPRFASGLITHARAPDARTKQPWRLASNGRSWA